MRTRLIIRGMSAVHAARAIRTALTAVDGIIAVDIARGQATIDHDGRASCDALRAAVVMAGYEVEDCIEDARALPLL